MKYSILGFDIEGFSKDAEAIKLQSKRHQLREIVTEAIRNANLSRLSGSPTVDTGDGFLMFLDSHDYGSMLVFLDQLKVVSKRMSSIRFRGILHRGDCQPTQDIMSNSEQDHSNIVGKGCNEAARYLESAALRELLQAESTEYFAFGISREVYDEIVDESFFDVSRYVECAVVVKTFNSSIFLHTTEKGLALTGKVSGKTGYELKEAFSTFLGQSVVSDFYSSAEHRIQPVYVFPNLSKDFETRLGKETVSASDYFSEYLQRPRNVIISGDEQIGKTSLCKEVYRLIHAGGKLLPILLRLNEQYSGNVDNKISEALRSQYLQEIRSPEGHKKVLIVDDFHLVPTRYQRKMLKEVFSMPNIFCILVVDSVYNINLFEREIDRPFDSLLMKEFSPSLRHDLIEKWMESEGIVDDNYRAIDELTDYLDNTLLQGLIPASPQNILVILAERRAFNPLKSEVTSKGHCYQTLIYLALRKATIQDAEYDIYLNFLEHLSYHLYLKGTSHVSEDEYIGFLRSYAHEYNQPIPEATFVRKLNESRIFCRNSLGEYHFHSKYIYFFFVAKYLADHRESKDVADKLASIYGNLQSVENGYIGVFVIHHIRDARVLEEIELNLLVQYDQHRPATLDSEEIDFLSKYVQSASRLSIEAQNKSYENRKRALLLRDEQDANDDEDEAFDVYQELKDLRKALRTAEVMGQILKTRTGSFKKDCRGSSYSPGGVTVIPSRSAVTLRCLSGASQAQTS